MENKYAPSLSLVYLPHLDYKLQRLGPRSPLSGPSATLSPSDGERDGVRGGHEINPAIVPDLRSIDAIVGDLIDFFQNRFVEVILLSEYGITNVDTPIHINRLFRKNGWITIKEELGLELLDCGASNVFAVADHQIAHIYLNDRSLEIKVRDFLERQTGIELVLGRAEQAQMRIDHPRSGDLIAVAKPHAWFTYYYWLDDRVAPDFARCVDIHRKPGYDPAELFLDPKIPAVKLKILWRLLQKKLGFRMLMDVIPLDASLVNGSHGRRPASTADYPLIITGRSELLHAAQINTTDVYHVIKRHV
jgi:predicted AlkP superfamily pyrophosphatase or phosphodiesterase